MKRMTVLLATVMIGLSSAAAEPKSDDYPDGKLGKALILGGNSYTVKIPHYAGLKPAKAITISAWIKPERVGKGEWDWQEIYRKEDGNARALMAIGEYEKKHSLCFGLGIGGKYVGHGIPLEPVLPLDGKWHLVCATYDGKAMKFYADGSRTTGDAHQTQTRKPEHAHSTTRRNHGRQPDVVLRLWRNPLCSRQQAQRALHRH